MEKHRKRENKIYREIGYNFHNDEFSVSQDVTMRVGLEFFISAVATVQNVAVWYIMTFVILCI